MKKKKKRKLKFKRVLLAIFVLLILSLIIYIISLLRVKTYYVYNNNYLTDEQVLDILKLNKKSSFLLTNTLTEKALIIKNKRIKDVKIKKTLSLEIKVYVTEYKILFYDKENNCSVLENGETVDYTYDNSPVLENKIEDKEIYKKFINKMNKVDTDILDIISEIKYVPNGIDKERFLFSMNDGNYVYITVSKLTKINGYKSVIDSVENKKGILYLDYGNYFVPKEN
jgi:cell division septal protein FtsQ